VKWKDPDGRTRYERIGEDREQAKAVLRKVEGDIVAGRHGLTLDPGEFPTFAEAAEVWLARRRAPGKDGQPAVRSWVNDRARLDHYLKPFFGRMRLNAIRRVEVKTFIEQVRPRLAAQSIRNCLGILSRLFNDHIEEDMPLVNPVARLDRATRRALGPKWDPKKTPFLARKDDLRRTYQALPEMAEKAPWRPMFATGVFAGLRTSEVMALEWPDVDFAARLIHIRRSATGPLKDDEARVAPLSTTLSRVLSEWREVAGQAGDLCFPSTGRRGRYVKKQSMYKVLDEALLAVGIERMTWYQCTRHTFASHWVMDGGSLEKLRVILGHSSTEVTLRYAHLVPGQFTEAERGLVGVELWDGAKPEKAKVAKSTHGGYAGVTQRRGSASDVL
jgi:integrase